MRADTGVSRCTASFLTVVLIGTSWLTFTFDPHSARANHAPGKHVTTLPNAMIVTTNIEEVWPKGDDLRHEGDIRSLVGKLLMGSPDDPDVLLLQEASRRSAKLVAHRLRVGTGKSYSVAVRPARRPVVHTGPDDITISETAVVINNTTMETVRTDTVTTTHRQRHAAHPDRRRAKIVQSIALLKRRGTSRSYGVASLHFHGQTAIKDAVDDAYRRRWARAVTEKLKRLAPPRWNRLYAIGGDFNQGGPVTTRNGAVGYRPFWRYLTRAQELIATEIPGRHLTHLFVSHFLTRGADRKHRSNSYSDHPFRWAVVGKDTVPPERPDRFQRTWFRGAAAPEVSWKPTYDYSTDEDMGSWGDTWTARWPARYKLWRRGQDGAWELIARVRASVPKNDEWITVVDGSALDGVTYEYKARSIDRVGLKSTWTRIVTTYRGEPQPN